MIVYLQNAVGFLIQTLPCVLMIFMPFPGEDYRFQRKRVFWWMTGMTAVAAALFSAVLCLRDLEKYPRHIMISNTLMLVMILLILAAYIWLVREMLIKKILVFAIVLFYAVTVFVLVNMLYAVLYPGQVDTTLYPYTGRFLMLYAAVTALLFPVMLFCVIRPLKEYILEIEPRNMRREFLIVMVVTLVYFALTIYGETSFGNIDILVLYLPVLVFLTLNQILIYWLVFRESVRRKRDNEQRWAMEIQQLQYEKIASDMESTRRMRHDLRHHYNALNDMLEREQLDEMREYLSGVIQTTFKRDSEIYCRNMTVNGLLQYYTRLARDADIRCKVRAECGDLAIEPADLTVLFGNAMENAINACKKCTENRWIDVQVGTIQGSLAIEISNSCKSVRLDRHFQTEDGFSPPEAFLSDRAGSGYGLRSIAHTAQKYDGSAKFRFNAEKEMFTARIRLNINKNL